MKNLHIYLEDLPINLLYIELLMWNLSLFNFVTIICTFIYAKGLNESISMYVCMFRDFFHFNNASR